MSDKNDPFGFGKFVPGFDFLQSLTRASAGGAPGAAMAGLPSWIAPTLDVGEIDKRIDELRAVQFWLDQNAAALKATLQALEVQKMTLATLRGMNVSMEDMAEALRARPAAHPFADMQRPVAPEGMAQAAEPSPAPAAAPEPAAPTQARRAPRAQSRAKTPPEDASSGAQPATAPRAGLVDPMQWWGALSEQFQQIAGRAMQDAAKPAGPFAQAFAPAPAPGTAAASAPARKPARSPAPRAPRSARPAAAPPPARKAASRRR